ncbi:hypothetical protein UR09_02750 [Candidatus Nitromaritima sp. SCGC AAA799-A02]|nr:hypothetical protein UR09_02750 [Candidatus Nitromaritima sp. SCGC AAA799-A02]KMP12116.1 hypothetical protein UZ36_02160 [Candidatus Nitromaritima sp. SCGC AAA799-C22]
MINKLAFISCPVTDLDRSIIFYRDVLGFKLLFIEDNWAEFDIDGQRLALHLEAARPKPDRPSGAAVYFTAWPIEETIEKLKCNGVAFHGEMETHSYGKLIGFSDPDGNPLGLYEPPAAGDSGDA